MCILEKVLARNENVNCFVKTHWIGIYIGIETQEITKAQDIKLDATQEQVTKVDIAREIQKIKELYMLKNLKI